MRLLLAFSFAIYLGHASGAISEAPGDECGEKCPGESADGSCPPDCHDCSCCSMPQVFEPPAEVAPPAPVERRPVASAVKVAPPAPDPGEISHVPKRAAA